jgi:uncharacterized membrane protein
MAALAYILLPISGVLAYFNASEARIRFHGLQAIALGLLWPLALYGASAISVGASQAVWGLGAVVWLLMMVFAGIGKDLRIPLLGSMLERAARRSPKAVR